MSGVETILETERLRLTNWSPEHIGDMVRLHGDPRVIRYISEDGEPETRAQVEARLALWADNFAQHRMGKLRVTRKSDGLFVGRAGFGIYPPTGAAEIGYALLFEHWGNGYAFEAASGLRDWFFSETRRDFFIGFADTRNEASLRILRGIGMIPTHQERDPGGRWMAQFHILERGNWLG